MTTQPLPSTLHVGLDVAKRTLQVDLAGCSVALANTAAGHRTLLTHLHRLATKTGRLVHVVCEGMAATSAPSWPPSKRPR